MCSIMGCGGGKVDLAAFQQGFERTASRGPDNWDGCDVDDPSARVLSYYGASGC